MSHAFPAKPDVTTGFPLSAQYPTGTRPRPTSIFQAVPSAELAVEANTVCFSQ